MVYKDSAGKEIHEGDSLMDLTPGFVGEISEVFLDEDEGELAVTPQAAPAHKIVAATMRSGMIVCSTNGCGRKPLTVTVDVPAPEMRAPSLRR